MVETLFIDLPVNKHSRHSQGPCNGTRMLTARPAKTRQNVTRGVMTSGLSQRSDWSTHGLVSNGNKTHGNLFHSQRILLSTILLGGQKLVYLENKEGFIRRFSFLRRNK